MNVKTHHTLEELKTLYRTEKNAKLAQRIRFCCKKTSLYRPKAKTNKYMLFHSCLININNSVFLFRFQCCGE